MVNINNISQVHEIDSRRQIEGVIKAELSNLLHVDCEDLKSDEDFFDLGIDSLNAVELIDQLSVVLGADLNGDPAVLYSHSTLGALSIYLSDLLS